MSALSILFTQSKGYSDNGTHPRRTVLIRQIYIETICIHDWKFYLVSDWVMCFGPGVDTQYLQGSGMSTESVEVTKLLQ